LSKIKSVIDGRHINARMFELKNNKDSPYRYLDTKDLQGPVRNNTLCSNEKRLYTLRLTNAQALEDFKEDCKKVFCYTKYISGKTRHDILNAMRVSVCPYCNRQFISPWGKAQDQKNTADIDHFYSKDDYPFLALSLYNFVPSCQICNSRFKLTNDFYSSPHVYPYKESFGERVRFEIGNIDALLDSRVLPNLLLDNSSGAEEIDHTLTTFNLKELYENHQDYAKEIIQKARMFSDTKLMEYLNGYSGMFSSKMELYQALYGNYLEEEYQRKRPLAKLTQDLLYDLGIEIFDD